MNDISRYERLTRDFLAPYQKELLEAMAQGMIMTPSFLDILKKSDEWEEVSKLFKEEL